MQSTTATRPPPSLTSSCSTLFCLLGLMGIAACGSSSADAQTTPGGGDGEEKGAGSRPGAGSADGGISAPAFGAGEASGASAGAPAPLPPSPGGVPVETQPGTLTAGVWDDNQNFTRFTKYRADLAAAVVDANSVGSKKPIVLPFTGEEHAAANLAFNKPRGAKSKLDIALVIDTTGSMGDEIAYLQTEFLALSESIKTRYPDSQQRWSLVVYKDASDEYITRWFDFRSDPDDFRRNLAAQSAGGGGDYPEASHAALAAMNQLSWRSDGDVARIAFWVADAPHHEAKVNEFASAVRAAAAQNIHIYPVASSGVDELTELSMRSTAQLSGGRYVFLTNDSGVGGVHKEPSIPCYFVTKLNHAIVRMVDAEISGMHTAPPAAHILRTGGNPQDGACVLTSGEVISIF